MKKLAMAAIAFVLSSAAEAQQNPYVTPYAPYNYTPPPSQIVDPNGCPKYCSIPRSQLNPQGSVTSAQEPETSMHKVGR
ncbi:hypothetical protein MJC1_00088 [Methylocystis sp. MJC1]|nr:hypothetical protein MJC1_00088 [Methylocystis sp. MJC1]